MKSRILIAEDSMTQATYLKMLLENQGYEVCTAADGQAAFEMMADFDPDLVITDVVMPKLNGFELCRKIKESANTKHVPVVLLTALDSSQDLVSGLEVRADNFIRKPYNDAYLLARVERIIASLNVDNPPGVLSLSGNGVKYSVPTDPARVAQIVELLLSLVEDLSQNENVNTENTRSRIDMTSGNLMDKPANLPQNPGEMRLAASINPYLQQILHQITLMKKNDLGPNTLNSLDKVLDIVQHLVSIVETDL